MTAIDLLTACQRHTRRRITYVTARAPFDPARYGVEPLATAQARRFVETHHYSGTFPAEISSYGLFEALGDGSPRLVGVCVFSAPVNTPQAMKAMLGPGQMVADLGRFVLTDSVLANAETWFLARAYAALRADKTLIDGLTPRFPFSTSYSDPCPRPAGDTVIFPGHIGTIYQASNALYTGRSRARTICLTRSGAIVSERAMSKLRADDADARHVYARLIEQGAPRIRPGETGRAYLARALSEGPFRRILHRGNHRYVLLPRDRSLRAALQAAFPALAYPKKTDPVPSLRQRIARAPESAADLLL
jgi:hypothetical protein